jgi:hypothetical protein
MGEPSS